MNTFPKIFCITLLTLSLNSFAQDSTVERKQISYTNENGLVTHDLWQPDQDHGVFESKQTDKTGKVTQWYQHYVDPEGKEIIAITREVTNGLYPPYESIEFITHYTYNADGNVSEFYEFLGDGTLRQHVVYHYDSAGKWLKGDIYDSRGKLIGHELTPPEAHLYGEKRKK